MTTVPYSSGISRLQNGWPVPKPNSIGRASQTSRVFRPQSERNIQSVCSRSSIRSGALCETRLLSLANLKASRQRKNSKNEIRLIHATVTLWRSSAGLRNSNCSAASTTAPRPSLIVFYGRRRVGKSTLILESLSGKRIVYHQASRLTDPDNLSLFKRSLETELGADPILSSLNDWTGVLAYLETLARIQPGLTVVLDEFPYLCEAQPALPSLVQTALGSDSRQRCIS